VSESSSTSSDTEIGEGSTNSSTSSSTNPPLRKTVADELAKALPPLQDALDPSRHYLGVIVRGAQQTWDQVSKEAEADKNQKFIGHAEDEHLTEWGTRYKTLGKHRGRGEETYRRYLEGLPVAYSGEGRAQDIRAAIASGLLTQDAPHPYDPHYDSEKHGDGGAIQLTSYPETLQYDVTVHDHAWASHPGGLVRELAEYADALVVEMRGLEFVSEENHIELDTRPHTETVASGSVMEVETSAHTDHTYYGRLEGQESFEGDDAFGESDAPPG
jgi:hypothetical protein